jgi:hypothetical protein
VRAVLVVGLVLAAPVACTGDELPRETGIIVSVREFPVACWQTETANGDDAGELNGPIVHAAAEQRCVNQTSGQVDVERLSAVHLSSKGARASASLSNDPGPQRLIFRQVRGLGRPVKRYEEFVRTRSISEDDFLAIEHFWKRYRGASDIPVLSILRRLDPQHQRWAERVLKRARANHDTSGFDLSEITKSNGPPAEVTITSQEKSSPVYMIVTRDTSVFFIAALPDGLEIICVGEII